VPGTEMDIPKNQTYRHTTYIGTYANKSYIEIMLSLLYIPMYIGETYLLRVSLRKSVYMHGYVNIFESNFSYII
jgi:hypothetical protein